MQTLIVAVLVTACSVYSLWALLPGAWKRPLALALLRLPLPAGLARSMRKASMPASGCACEGCDRAPAKQSPDAPPGAPQVIRFQPRLRR